MSIDECIYSFAELAESVLPKHLGTLRSAMVTPRLLKEFCTAGIGVRTLLKRVGRTTDFSGCYVLLRENKPFYIGISRGVVARLRQHGVGRTHFDASLAYRMACKKVDHELTRDAAMRDATFIKAFNQAKQMLRESSVAYVEITNPLELYVFEPYCAMELDTSEWNTFRTH